MTDNTLLPPEYGQAAAALQAMLTSAPLPPDAQGKQLPAPADLKISVSKGFNVQMQRADTANDSLEVSIQSAALTSSDTAHSVAQAALAALNNIQAVRDAAVLVPPAEYSEQVKKELGGLQEEARKAHVSGKHIDLRDIDLTQWKGLDPKYSFNQIPDYTTQLIENPNQTQIRVNIPTNPQQREEAMTTAESVAKNLRQRLPEIKSAMIQRVLDKNYVSKYDNDPKGKEDFITQMKAHTFEVTTQQQGNWTSVFVNIRSPQQQEAAAKPGEMPDPQLPNSNMLSQVDEKSRLKLVARSVLFEGEGLKKPSAIFMDVAGAKDMENLLGKAMYYLVQAKPELKDRAKALMDENLFKLREQWNLPGQARQEYKHEVVVGISPEHPDTLKITLSLAKGEACKVAQAIAAAHQPATPEAAVPCEVPSAPPVRDPYRLATLDTEQFVQNVLQQVMQPLSIVQPQSAQPQMPLPLQR